MANKWFIKTIFIRGQKETEQRLCYEYHKGFWMGIQKKLSLAINVQYFINKQGADFR